MSLLEDVRFALRLLLKRPWTSLAVVSVLAAGISVNSLVFTLVNGAFFKGLPFEEADELLIVATQRRGPALQVADPDYRDWRAQTKTFEDLGAFRDEDVNLSDDEAFPERREATRITPNTFDILRVQAQLGRTFLKEEAEPGAEAVVLLGHSVWRNRYGGDPDVVGRSIRVNSVPHTIIGVMEQGFRYPFSTELWLPLFPDESPQRRLLVVGRLAEGQSQLSAQAEMTVIAKRLAEQRPETNEGFTALVQTYNQAYNQEVMSIFTAMLAAVGFVLLIACANVANIQLARAADRAREMSIRTAIGASRGRIVRQVLVESVMLAFCGGLAGWALSWFGIRAFDEATAGIRPFWIEFPFDATVFAYLTALAVGAGVVFGLAPALHAARTNVNEVLQEGSRGQTGGRGTRRISSVIVVAEVVAAMVLLVGGGLVVRSYWNVYHQQLGFETANILNVRFDLPAAEYPRPEDRIRFFDRLISTMRSLPGVEAATSTNRTPGAGFSSQRVEIQSRPEPDPEKRAREQTRTIDSSYLRALGIPLLRGRDFGPGDSLEAPAVAIINERFVQKYFPGEDPLGARIVLGQGDDRPVVTVVGVCATIREVFDDLPPVLYLPYRQGPTSAQTLLLRSSGDPGALIEPVREAVALLHPDLPLYEIGPLDERLRENLWGFQVFGSFFLCFAVVALILAAIGVYSLVADSVSRRIPEFGIRMALGADARSIVRLIVGQGMRRVLIGVGIGLPLAFGAGYALEGVLLNVEPIDPATMTIIPAFLILVALIACWIPAVRARRMSANDALRSG